VYDRRITRTANTEIERAAREGTKETEEKSEKRPAGSGWEGTDSNDVSCNDSSKMGHTTVCTEPSRDVCDPAIFGPGLVRRLLEAGVREEVGRGVA
jgi:hypothetical protein